MKNEHRILVVEDTASLRNSMETILGNSGYAVDAAADANEALRLFKKHVPCLVLLDILLPERDGLDLLADIRKLPGGKSVPVFVITQLGETEYRQRAKTLGVQRYYVKANISLSELLSSAEKCLKSCKSSAPKPAAAKKALSATKKKTG